MHSTIVKKVLLFLSLFIVMSLACDLSVAFTPTLSQLDALIQSMRINP